MIFRGPVSTPPVKKLKAHLFICNNERKASDPRGCCKLKGSEALVAAFKDELNRVGIKDIRAQRAGCLDACEYGPSVVVYPEGIWYGNVQLKDVEEIVLNHLRNGTPVERLRIPGK